MRLYGMRRRGIYLTIVWRMGLCLSMSKGPSESGCGGRVLMHNVYLEDLLG